MAFMYGSCGRIGNKTEWDVRRFYPDICEAALAHIGPIHSHYTREPIEIPTRGGRSLIRDCEETSAPCKYLLSAPFKCLLSPSVLRSSHSVQFAEAGQVGRASTVTGAQIQRNPKKINESNLWNFKVFRKASEVEVFRDCGAMNAKLNQKMCFVVGTKRNDLQQSKLRYKTEKIFPSEIVAK